MKAIVATFNQEKALVGIVQLLYSTNNNVRLLLPVGVEQCLLPVSSTISARHTGLSSAASVALAMAQRREARAQQSPRIISSYISSPLGVSR